MFALPIVQFLYAQMVIKKQRPNLIYSELYIQNVPVNCFTFGRCATLRGEAAHWDTLYIDLDKCSFFARKVVGFLEKAKFWALCAWCHAVPVAPVAVGGGRGEVGLAEHHPGA